VARTDAIVLGAGIVGTSIALHLARSGLSVSLVDRRPPGEETSYGNAGIIEGNTVFPAAFPSSPAALLRIALKLAPEANYHLRFLSRAAPWLLAFRAASRPRRLAETARLMRPLFAIAIAEHETLLREAGAIRFLRTNGWLKLYRSQAVVAALGHELDFAAELGIKHQRLDVDATLALEPALAPTFRQSVFWPSVASLSDPLAVTRAYAERFAVCGGVLVRGDACSLHRIGSRWRVETAEGPIDAGEVVVALGPFAPDLLDRFGVRLPLGVKRGYHRHYRTAGAAQLTRPLLDVENGYCLAPMAQGIRLTTGAEFAAHDAAPTPVQLDRVQPAARALIGLGEPLESQAWMGSRPCFPDSRPVIGRAPGHAGLWLAYGHAHWGLTLGPATGRLVAEMMTGRTPFCDPAPYRAERFIR
jgi:D-amino-acid dehydrogenase